MWIQLTSTQHIEQRGVMRAYHPGDWIEVGKQMAMLLLSKGEAILPGQNAEVPIASLVASSNAGVVVPSGWLATAKEKLPAWNIFEGEPEARFERTIIWSPEVAINPPLFSVGLSLLDRWEIAVPLYDYKVLAISVGTDEERERTKAVIHDLRVPLYDIRLRFAKKTLVTGRLFKKWKDEPGDERRLAFLRALYVTKPLILALPATWTGWNYAQ